MYQTPDGLIEVRLQHVTFSKQLKGRDTITHKARNNDANCIDVQYKLLQHVQ